MAKRQSKSRSVGHCKSSTERRIVSPVERAIHMKIKETFAIVARMPEYSRLAENSITTMFVGLVTEYGSRSCVAAIDRIRREGSEDRAIVLETNMYLALASLASLAAEDVRVDVLFYLRGGSNRDSCRHETLGSGDTYSKRAV